MFFISKLYSKNSNNSVLYDSVLFENVSSFSIRDFISIFDIDGMHQSTWNRIPTSLEQDFHSNAKQSYSFDNAASRYRIINEDKSSDKDPNTTNRNQNRQQCRNTRIYSTWTNLDSSDEIFDLRARQQERNESLRNSQRNENEKSYSSRNESNLNQRQQRTENEKSYSSRNESKTTKK